MNRMRVLKQRAMRGFGTAFHFTGCYSNMKPGWYVAWGTSFFDSGYDGPMSKREAYQMAARASMPRKQNRVRITFDV